MDSILSGMWDRRYGERFPDHRSRPDTCSCTSTSRVMERSERTGLDRSGKPKF